MSILPTKVMDQSPGWGLIKTLEKHKSKKGDATAFLPLEDVTGEVEVVVFSSAYGHCSHLLSSDEPLVIQGQVQKAAGGVLV